MFTRKFSGSKKTGPKATFGSLNGKGKSRTEANAAGYEKRQARKAKAGPALADLYEHVQQNKGRRSKIGMDLDRDEAKEYGVGLDGANDEEREELRARLIGELEDDEEIASDDDEEIDSDAAFEESDEERFAGFFSAKKSKSKPAKKPPPKSAVRFADVNLDEDEDMESSEEKAQDNDSSEEEEEEEEEGDDDEFIDLLDVLDGKGDIDMGSDDETAAKSKSSATSSSRLDAEHETYKELEEDKEGEEDEEETSEEEEDDDEPQDQEMVFEPSDDEDAPEALDRLNDFVSSLDVTAKKRKAPEEDGAATNTDARARKRRFTKERTEAGDENEFRAHSSGSKLNLDDLLAPLASQSSTLESLKKSTKVLGPSSSSKAKAKALSAPLPQRTQERLDRQAAYEQTKEEVDKWTDTMKRIREAEHLSFPLQAQSKGRVSNLALNAKFKPTTELESSVDALLKSAKMREEDINQTEDKMLEMNKLSVEEVAQRRAELRKMRELMFRADIKAKRIGKIKSKTYRRLRRKEKERLGEKIDEEDSDPEASKMKAELDRARERATLRHKHTGKWARQMRHMEGMDEDSRRDIEEMLARGEKLRRRIKGVGSDESEGGEDDDDDVDDDNGLDVEANIEKIKAGAFDELRRLEEEVGAQDDEKRKGKSVFEMKFMKDAMARRELEANQEKDDFIKEMGGHVPGGDDSDQEEESTEEPDPSSGVVARRAGGRIVYRPGTDTNASSRPLHSLASDTSSVTLRSADFISPPLSPAQNRHSGLSNSIVAPSQDSNPWLTHDASNVKTTKPAKKANEVMVGKDSKPAEKAKNKLKKVAQKKVEERERAKDDAVVDISLDDVLGSTSASAALRISGTQSEKKGNKVAVQLSSAGANQLEDSDDDNIELKAQEQALMAKGKGKANGVKAFEQRDLVALAFAGDNVVRSFEEAKRQEIAADAPKEVDTTIPGWGSWGGSGIRKAPPKPSRIKKIAGIDPTTRADYNKKNIIISEKRDKKAGKYLVKDLPYPYTSKAQFERAMERPLGVEWNTRVVFQRATLPKVVKKPGVIIDPLEKHTI
ncbi:Utp14-domain-containing protein [Pholiota conissans]|uniref:Utp14-domain-containing protein n=1 Tax=Pholiota conissans TaxID=109636 RepID=A0A9P5Z004_9AGAR|nr:Utp14-domain-containing protein [Pholiota conissans]